jgi:hypothetical protein
MVALAQACSLALLLLLLLLLLQVSASQGTLNLWETNRGTDSTEMALLVRQPAASCVIPLRDT